MRRHLVGVLFWVGLGFLSTGWVESGCLGAVINLGATVSADVQELINGSPGSSNGDEQVLGEDATEPPLVVAASLESTDLGGNLTAFGRAGAEFEDPERLVDPNPQDLAVEVGCFSNDAAVSYVVTGNSTEIRRIIFTRPGNPIAPSEIEFRADGTREIESSVFLSGAILIWHPNLDSDGDGLPDGSLDGLETAVTFSVERTEPADTLFRTTLTITASGEIINEPDTTGPIRVESVTLDELIELGIDAESAAILEQVAEEGVLRIFVIPQQEHRYRYVVTADQAFELTADLELRARNLPDGVGIAATLGRPFAELAELIEDALTGVDGQAVEQSINAAIARRNIGLVPSSSPPRAGLCGALGMEALAMLAMTTLFLHARLTNRAKMLFARHKRAM